MNNTVTLCENALDSSTWTTHENVGDVRDFLISHFGIWPDTAHIYLDHVANNADITPHDEAGVERLGKIKGHFFVVVYPQGIELILIIVALVIAAVAISLVFLFRPSVKKNQNEDSANNQLANRTNQARPLERIPDIYGTLWATADLLAVPYRTFEFNQEIEHCYMCIGRGEYAINASDIRDDTTPLIQGLSDVIEEAGTSVGVYGPFKSPNRPDTPDIQIGPVINEKVVNLQVFSLVNGQAMRAPNLDTFYGANDIIFSETGEIFCNSGRDFAKQFSIGDEITIGGLTANDDLAVDPGGHPSVHLGGQYQISFVGPSSLNGVGMSAISLVNPAGININWNALFAFTPGPVTHSVPASINLVANGAFKAGPFTIINPSMSGFWCNFVAPQGMYIIDKKGRQVAWGANVRVFVTQCDATGTPIGPQTSYVCAISGNKTDRLPKGSTLKIPIFPLPGFAGIIVEAKRTTNTDLTPGNTVVDQVQWRDAYVVSDVPQADFGNVTTIQTRTIPTPSALAQKERKLNALVTRKIPHWTGSGTAFTANTATMNGADILCAMALDPFIGDRTVAELDLVNIYQVAGVGGDIDTYFGNPHMTEFCYTFDDSKVSFEESVGDLAQAIFCVAYRRGSLLSLSFEQATVNSVLLFNHRNKVPKSETRTVTFGAVNDNDGINLDYIEPNAPNYPEIDTTVTLYFPQDQSAKNPKKVTAIGVRNQAQALALGFRLYNKLIYQNTVVEFDATEETALLIPQDRILVADNTRADVQDGDVLDQVALLLTLSQDVVFDGVSTYTIFLQNADGTVESLGIIPGPQANQVILASPPTLPCVIDPDMYARTTYMIVSSAPTQTAAFLLSEKTPKDGKLYSVKAVNYDASYYSMDTTVGAGGGLPTGNGLNPFTLFMPTTHGVVINAIGGQPSYGQATAAASSGEMDQWTSRSLSFWGSYVNWDYAPPSFYAAPGSDAVGVPPRSQITDILAVGIDWQDQTWFCSLDFSVDGGVTWNGLGGANQSATRWTASILLAIGGLSAIPTFDFTLVQFRMVSSTSLNFDLAPPGNKFVTGIVGIEFLFNGAKDSGGAGGFGPATPATGYILNPLNSLSQSSSTQIDMAVTDCLYIPNGVDVTFNARTFAIADPGSTPVVYYVIISDPNEVGDSGGTLTSRISTTPGNFAIGEVTIGPILAIHGTSTPGVGGSGSGPGTPATGNEDGGTTYRFQLNPAGHGDFIFAHGLGVVPLDVRIGNTSDGAIRFQPSPSPPWDITNVYLNSSDDNLTAFLEIDV